MTGETSPRVAVLVFNDAGNDSRVLKESGSLAGAGYRVRILAVERRQKDLPAAITALGANLELQRVPEFAVERLLPALAPVWRRLISSPSAADEPAAEADAAAPATPGSGGAADSGERPGAPRGGLVSHMRGRSLRALRGIGERAYRTLSLGTYWVNATREARHFEPDVVHANDANTLVPALALKALSAGRVGIVYDSHELWRHRNVRTDRWLAPFVEAVTEYVGIRHADAVITVSPSIAEWLRTTYRLPEEPTLVRNVPLADGAPDRSTGVLRERAGLSRTDKVIAYGGRITTARGIEETIAALPHLAESVHFVLLGYGEADALEHVRDQAREHGVADRVHLVGAVAPDQVSRALADGDVAVVHVRPVCLSYRYALPNKLFESIRAGLPIAVADLPDMTEVVRSLGVGEVFPGSRPADLATALQEILDAPEGYQQRAREVAAGLTWEIEAERMLEIYRRIAGAGGGPPVSDDDAAPAEGTDR